MTTTPTPTPAPAPLAPLWPRGIQIPYIGVSGEYQSGKSMFAALIDPLRTIYYDFEKSVVCYAALGFAHIDFPALMLAKFPQGRYRPIDTFMAWRDHLAKQERGKYRVMVLDDISTLETGLVEYVRKNPAEFGYSTAQFAKSEALTWGAAKNCWKQTLLTAGVECCVMVAHTRQVFAGGMPVKGKREAKGLDTIMELCTLYLHLDRAPDAQGRVPEAPNAVLTKNRLVVFVPEGNGVVPKPALPPRITGCTPEKIRWYINNPPNYAKLAKDQLVVEKEMSADERLLVESQIAEANARAAEAQLANQALVTESAALRIQAMGMRAQQTAAPDQSAQVQAQRDQRIAENAQVQQTLPGVTEEAEQPAEPAPVVAHAPVHTVDAVVEMDTSDAPAVQLATEQQLLAMRDLKAALAIPAADWRAAMARRGVESAKFLTEAAADQFIAALMQRQRQKADAAHAAAYVDSHVMPAQPPAPPTPAPSVDSWGNQMARPGTQAT